MPTLELKPNCRKSRLQSAATTHFNGRWLLNRSLIRLAAVTLLQACLAQTGQATNTNAVIPYKTMDDLCQMADGVDQTKLIVRVFVSSRNKAVQSSDIGITIQSATKGMIPVQIGTNGQVLNFPHEKELRRENPSLIANQPKGTLNLSLRAQLAIPDELTFRYRRLGDGVAEANKTIKAQAGMLSLFAPKAEGVTFFFPEASGGKAKVEIMLAAGKKEYTADQRGQVKLKLEKAILTENPEVKVSEKPQLVMPDME
jgi:hypothetical protein